MSGLENVDLLLKESRALLRENKPEESLKKAELAVSVSAGASEAQLRRVICLCKLNRFGEAKSLLKYIGDSYESKVWLEIVNQKEDAEIEVPRIPAAIRKNVEQVRTDWYQSSSGVTLTVYQKDLPNDTKVLIEPKRLSITCPGFEWEKPLNSEISVEHSTFEITKFKCEFKLSKAVETTWKDIEPSKPVKPVISYNKWDKISDSDEDEESKGDPMEFFQNLYKNSSPEVRRAMMKSYTESNGTALSTNWEDVRSKKVEVCPPHNMEATNF